MSEFQDVDKEQAADEGTADSLNKPVDQSALQPSNGATARGEAGRGEVSATTVARIMGVATVADLNLLDSKIELMSNRINNLTIRMEKVLTMLSQAPSESAIERIDVQIGHLRTMIKEALANRSQAADED